MIHIVQQGDDFSRILGSFVSVKVLAQYTVSLPSTDSKWKEDSELSFFFLILHEF